MDVRGYVEPNAREFIDELKRLLRCAQASAYRWEESVYRWEELAAADLR
jgi:hypothetical protein